MSKVFEFNTSQGSLKDHISKTIPTNTNMEIKVTEKGKAGYFDTTADLDGFGVVTGVKTIVMFIKPTADSKLLLDNNVDRLEISGTAISGTGLTQNYVNETDTDTVNLNEWQMVVSEFSGGIDFATDFEIDPTANTWIARVKMFDTVLTATQRSNEYNEFLHSYNIEVPIRNFFIETRPVGRFDGIDDEVNLDSTITLDNSQPWKFKCKIKPYTNGNFHLVSNSDVDEDSRIYMSISVGPAIIADAGAISAVANDTDYNPAANEWSDIEFECTGSTVTCTVNGSTVILTPVEGFFERVTEINNIGGQRGQATAVPYYIGEMRDVEVITPTTTYKWNFRDAQGTNIDDSSNNCNDGTLSNSNNSTFWVCDNIPSNVYLYETFATNGADGVNKLPLNWESGTGTYAIKEDAESKYMECTGDGIIGTQQTQAYGTWEFTVLKKSGNTINFAFINQNTIANNTKGYYLNFNTSEKLQFIKTDGAGSLDILFKTYVDAIDNDKYYTIRFTRTLSGIFTAYIKGGAYTNWTVMTVAEGSNPVTDNTYTTSNILSASLDTGDRIRNITLKQR